MADHENSDDVLPPGQRVLGEYELEWPVDRSPLWTVYGAVRTGAGGGGRALLWVLSPELAARRGLVEELDDHAHALRALRHPSIVPVAAAGAEGGTFMIASPRPAEATVRSRLEAVHAGLEPRETARIVTQVAEALAAMHAKAPPVAHGALAPRKIVLEHPGGRAAVLEAGFMHVLRAVDPSITAMAIEPTYQAPEAWRERAAPSAAADQFVLASIAFECVVGVAAFPDAEALEAALAGRLPYVASHDSELPDELDEVLHRAWSRDPSARFATAADFARRFAGVVAGGPSRVYRPSAFPGVPQGASDHELFAPRRSAPPPSWTDPPPSILPPPRGGHASAPPSEPAPVAGQRRGDDAEPAGVAQRPADPPPAGPDDARVASPAASVSPAPAIAAPAVVPAAVTPAAPAASSAAPARVDEHASAPAHEAGRSSAAVASPAPPPAGRPAAAARPRGAHASSARTAAPSRPKLSGRRARCSRWRSPWGSSWSASRSEARRGATWWLCRRRRPRRAATKPRRRARPRRPPPSAPRRRTPGQTPPARDPGAAPRETDADAAAPDPGPPPQATPPSAPRRTAPTFEMIIRSREVLQQLVDRCAIGATPSHGRHVFMAVTYEGRTGVVRRARLSNAGFLSDATRQCIERNTAREVRVPPLRTSSWAQSYHLRVP